MYWSKLGGAQQRDYKRKWDRNTEWTHTEQNHRNKMSDWRKVRHGGRAEGIYRPPFPSTSPVIVIRPSGGEDWGHLSRKSEMRQSCTLDMRHCVASWKWAPCLNRSRGNCCDGRELYRQAALPCLTFLKLIYTSENRFICFKHCKHNCHHTVIPSVFLYDGIANRWHQRDESKISHRNKWGNKWGCSIAPLKGWNFVDGGGLLATIYILKA